MSNSAISAVVYRTESMITIYTYNEYIAFSIPSWDSITK